MLSELPTLYISFSSKTHPYHFLSQPAHDVRMTLYGRCYDVKTLKTTSIQRHLDVVCWLGLLDERPRANS